MNPLRFVVMVALLLVAIGVEVGVASSATGREAAPLPSGFDAWRPWLDYGVPLIVLAFLGYLVTRPPAWVRTVVDSHHQLAVGASALPQLSASVTELVNNMPKHGDIQELLLGQEAQRREILTLQSAIHALRSDLKGAR